MPRVSRTFDATKLSDPEWEALNDAVDTYQEGMTYRAGILPVDDPDRKEASKAAHAARRLQKRLAMVDRRPRLGSP